VVGQTQGLVKPTEPGPEDCCQSGCLECVWDVYRRELLEYEKVQAIALGKPEPVDSFEMERQ